MASLGHSIVPSSQVLQPNLQGGANPSGAHYPNPMFSSRVEALAGCGGGRPPYNMVSKTQMGGSNGHRRGGSKHQRKSRRRCSKKHSCRGKCHCKRRQYRKRSKKHGGGGLSALSPLSVSGGTNDSYGQYGNQSYFEVGSKTPILSSMANPPPINGYTCSS